MKKLTFILTFTAFALFSFSNCSISSTARLIDGEYTRTVLLEDVTATWCTFCPAAAKDVEKLAKEYPKKLVVLAVHVNDEYASKANEIRGRAFEVKSIPTILFNGVESPGYEYTSLKKDFEDHLSIGSPLKMNISASFNDRKDSIQCKVTVIVSSKLKKTLEGNLRIALIEDSVSYDGRYTKKWNGILFDVVRYLSTPTADDKLKLEQGKTLSFEKVISIDTSWKSPFKLAAWIEDKSLISYQAAFQEIK